VFCSSGQDHPGQHKKKAAERKPWLLLAGTYCPLLTTMGVSGRAPFGARHLRRESVINQWRPIR